MSETTPYHSHLWDVSQKIGTAIEQDLDSFAMEVFVKWQFKQQLKEVPSDKFRVLVTPRGATNERVSRVSDDSQYLVQIIVTRRLADADTDEDALGDLTLGFAEAIQKYFRSPRRQPDGLSYVSSEFEPVYGDDHLQDFRQFTSVLLLTVRRLTT